MKENKVELTLNENDYKIMLEAIDYSIKTNNKNKEEYKKLREEILSKYNELKNK